MRLPVAFFRISNNTPELEISKIEEARLLSNTNKYL